MHKPFRPRRTHMAWMLAALVAVGAAGLAAPARAAGDTPAAPGPSEPSWLEQSAATIGGAMKSLGDGTASLWSAVTGVATPSEPFQSLPAMLSDDDRKFFAVLDAAGLQLSEIKVGGSMLSPTTYRLVAAREPSTADLQRAEQMLSDYRASDSGLRAAAKQRIARAVLDLANGKGFLLSAMTIELSPWPTASYELQARNRPPEAAERRVLDNLRTQ